LRFERQRYGDGKTEEVVLPKDADWKHRVQSRRVKLM
jgi:hypothetical protein